MVHFIQREIELGDNTTSNSFQRIAFLYIICMNIKKVLSVSFPFNQISGTGISGMIYCWSSFASRLMNIE